MGTRRAIAVTGAVTAVAVTLLLMVVLRPGRPPAERLDTRRPSSAEEASSASRPTAPAPRPGVIPLDAASDPDTRSSSGGEPSVAELAREVDLVASGRVLSTRSEWINDHTLIVTYVTVRSGKVYKGSPGSEFVLREMGGTVNGITLTTSRQTSFREGEDVIAFAKVQKDDTSLYSCWGGGAGKLSVEGDRVRREIGGTVEEGTLADVEAVLRETLRGGAKR